jgi:methylated-DNA-[protein]-cysteine S-methyltransferase
MQREEQKKIFRTRLGWVGVSVSGQGVSRVVLPKKDRKAVERELISPGSGVLRGPEKGQSAVVLNKVVKLLQKYFSGERVSVDLWVDLRGYTPFQQAVWETAAQIPWGETRSYGWIAKQIKRPQAARAVGQAMGANPVPIIVP